jgi:hypothetical protein
MSFESHFMGATTLPRFEIDKIGRTMQSFFHSSKKQQEKQKHQSPRWPFQGSPVRAALQKVPNLGKPAQNHYDQTINSK